MWPYLTGGFLGLVIAVSLVVRHLERRRQLQDGPHGRISQASLDEALIREGRGQTHE